MVKVMVAGDFGKLHSGHLDHIRKAYQLGDWLIIVTHSDESISARKPYEPDPLWMRMQNLKAFLAGLGGQGEVRLAVDTDGQVTRTLQLVRPNIFAKGGDRTADNMPHAELEICKALGIRIVYGIGDRLNESRVIA